MQSRDEFGKPFGRGDDKVNAYLLHNIEDVIVFMDLKTMLNGRFEGIAR